MFWSVSPWCYAVYDSLTFLYLSGYSLSHFRENFNYIILKYFLITFLFVLFWDNYDLNTEVFNVFPKVSEAVFISSSSFFFLYSALCQLFSSFYLSVGLSGRLLQFCYWFPLMNISSQLLCCSLNIVYYLNLPGPW